MFTDFRTGLDIDHYYAASNNTPGAVLLRGNGWQYVANSVQALLTAQQLSPFEWTTSTEDMILEDGNTSYC